MLIMRTCHGYESISLSVTPDYDSNRTIYKVVDMRKGKFGHNNPGAFDEYVFETPCEARAKYFELAEEFVAANGKEG